MQENCVEHEALTIITSNLVNYSLFRGYFHKIKLQNKGIRDWLPFKKFLKLEKLQAKLQHPFQFGRRCGVFFFGSRQFVSTFFWQNIWSRNFCFLVYPPFLTFETPPEFFSDWQNLQRNEESVEVLKGTICFLDFICITFQMMGVESESFSSAWGPSEVTCCWNMLKPRVT